MNRAFSRKKDKSWMHTPETLSKNFIAYNAKIMSTGNGSDCNTAEKRGSKKRHLQCHDCEIPCRSQPLQQQEPTVKDMYIWVCDFVSSNISTMSASVNELKQAFADSQQSGPKRLCMASLLRPMKTTADIEYKYSSDEDSFNYYFLLEKTQRLLKSIWSGDQYLGPREASTSASRGPRAFKADETLP